MKNQEKWLNMEGKTGGAFMHYIDMANHTQTLDKIYLMKQRPLSTQLSNRSKLKSVSIPFNQTISENIRDSIENHAYAADLNS
jgi:hypothetical protein